MCIIIILLALPRFFYRNIVERRSVEIKTVDIFTGSENDKLGYDVRAGSRAKRVKSKK